MIVSANEKLQFLSGRNWIQTIDAEQRMLDTEDSVLALLYACCDTLR